MVVCEDAFIEGIPEVFADWEKIYVSKEDASFLAVNGLPISEEVYITDPTFADSVGAPLESKGIQVEYVDFSITRSMGGSFRCTTQALARY